MGATVRIESAIAPIETGRVHKNILDSFLK